MLTGSSLAVSELIMKIEIWYRQHNPIFSQLADLENALSTSA
jgi:hypothetical protein